jgi:hypothetical protein
MPDLQDPPKTPTEKDPPPAAKTGPATPPAPAPGRAAPDILLTEAIIIDDDPDNQQPLVNGVLVTGGVIRVEEVLGTVNCPLVAWIISEDESAVYPGSAGYVGLTADGKHRWLFKWTEVPALGCNCTLRIKELVETDGVGAVVNVTVHIVADVKAAPCNRE